MLLSTFVKVQLGWGEFRSGLRERLVDLTGSERGGVAAEYALLIALIAVVITVGAIALGNAVSKKLDDTATCIGKTPASC
jgi:Flp pilus assembly pilin Flp